MASIDERIAELEQRIAEKKAYQRMYRPNRNMAAWDYVAEGDRSGYDKIDASEAAYHNMLEQQRFNAKENDLNRKNAKSIANMNNIVAANDKMDELTRLRGRALVNLQYAEAAYKQAKDRGDVASMESANRDIQLAKEDLAYYNKRLGNNVIKESKEVHKLSEEEPTEGEESESSEGEGEETPVNLSVDIERYKAITKGKKAELDSILKEIKDNPNFNQSPELQREYQRISKIKSTEQLQSEKAARKAKWEEGKKLSGSALRTWASNPENKNLLKEFGPIGKYTGA